MAKTAINNARIIDGTGRLLENASILFDENGIIDVGQGPFTGDETIDAKGMTVMPGLMDCHTHLGLEPSFGGFAVAAKDTETQTAIRTYDQCLKLLSFGVTTVRNMGTKFDTDIVARNMINNKEIKGPRILASGKLICITGGHGHAIGTECDTVEEALKAARTQIKKGADVLKMIATGGVLTGGSSPGAPQLSRAQMEAVCREAANTGRLTGAHCIGYEGTRDAVFAGLQSIEHGYTIDDELADIMKERGIFLSPTIMAVQVLAEYDGEDPVGIGMRVKIQDIAPLNIAAFKLCHKKGVKIAASTDMGTPFITPGTLITELGRYVRYGMSPMEAIMTATKNASELLRLDKILGTLEKGKLADVILVDGDPLSDMEALRKVKRTYRSGELMFER